METIEEKFKSFEDNLSRWKYLFDLYYSSPEQCICFMRQNLTKIFPIIQNPTIAEVCHNYTKLFPSTIACGLHLSYEDSGNFLEKLEDYKEQHQNISVVAVTDGSRILGYGDLGVCGLPILHSKLTFYSLFGGIDPRECLPILIDFGCNSDDIVNDPEYPGIKARRIKDDKVYYSVMTELYDAVKEVYPGALYHYEDFSNDHTFELLRNTKTRGLPTFNDDIQCTGYAVAGLLTAAFRCLDLYGLPNQASQQRYLIVGMGSAGTGVAKAITSLILDEGFPESVAKERIWFVDSKGLVHNKRKDFVSKALQSYKTEFVNVQGAPFDISELSEIVRLVRPTVLIGISAQKDLFTQEIIEEFSSECKLPIILSLSNPASMTEIPSHVAYEYTKGKMIYGAGSPMQNIIGLDGKSKFSPSHANNIFIFPGLALGVKLAEASTITDSMFAVASKALAAQVPESSVKIGLCLPPLSGLAETTKRIALAVHKQAINEGVARNVNEMSMTELDKFMWKCQ